MFFASRMRGWIAGWLGEVGASVDARRLILANGARMVAYGMLGVLLVLYLTELGFDALRIGFILTTTMMGSALLNLFIVALAARYGSRTAYVIAHLVMVGVGVLLITQKSFLAFLIAGMTGTMNFTSPIASGFVALDQSIIPNVVAAESRNAVYGAYNSVALLARMIGSLLGAVPGLLLRIAGLELIIGYRLMLGSFVLFALISLLLILPLSPAIEGNRSGMKKRKIAPFRLERSGAIVRRLSLLFSVDALATGFIPQSLIVLWFNLRFGVGGEILGPAYSAIRLLQATGYPVAMWIAGRIGLLNTMVFTHLPAQAMLVAMPLMPSMPLALGLLFIQQGLSNMDIPARQAYIASVVGEEERTAAAGITNLTRNIAQGISPSFSGLAFRALAYGLPFVLAGLVGSAYDLALYFSFRSLQSAEQSRCRVAKPSEPAS